MKPEQVEVGLVVRMIEHPTEVMTISTGAYSFDGQHFVTCKAGKRAVPRMVALDALEPVEQKKGEQSNV